MTANRPTQVVIPICLPNWIFRQHPKVQCAQKNRFNGRLSIGHPRHTSILIRTQAHNALPCIPIGRVSSISSLPRHWLHLPRDSPFRFPSLCVSECGRLFSCVKCGRVVYLHAFYFCDCWLYVWFVYKYVGFKIGTFFLFNFTYRCIFLYK